MDEIDRALERNLTEIHNAIQKRTASVAMKRVAQYGFGFFLLVDDALFNDVLAHVARVFDRTDDTRALPYLREQLGEAFRSAITRVGVDYDRLTTIAHKVKEIRNKTRAHISQETITDPKGVWTDIDLKGDELDYALRMTHALLADLWSARTGECVSDPDYDGEDVLDILKAYSEAHRDAPVWLTRS